MRVHFGTLLLAISLAGAPDAPAAPPDAAQLVDDWGQILYCRQAYQHPDNDSRVYENDTRQCELAGYAIEARLLEYDGETRVALERAARQRMRMILANTHDITRVVGACREACEALAAAAPSDDAP